MSGPRRIQLCRKAGWRKPEGAVVVARPGRFGNPFVVVDGDAERAVYRFRLLMDGNLRVLMRDLPGSTLERFAVVVVALKSSRRKILAGLGDLRGRDVACWCRLDRPCHGDVLLDFANR